MTDEGEMAKEPARPAESLDPIGEALRATYDAENHDSLGGDLTGLMLALARVDDPVPPSVPAPVPAPIADAPRSWRQRLFGR